MAKNIAIGFLALALLVVGGLYLTQSAPFGAAAGQDHTFTENLLAGFTVGGNGVQNGTLVTKIVCGVVDLNPPSISSSTVATTTIQFGATTTVALTDKVLTRFATTTNSDQWFTTGSIASSGASGAVTFKLSALAGLAWSGGLNLSTSTAEGCLLQTS